MYRMSRPLGQDELLIVDDPPKTPSFCSPHPGQCVTTQALLDRANASCKKIPVVKGYSTNGLGAFNSRICSMNTIYGPQKITASNFDYYSPCDIKKMSLCPPPAPTTPTPPPIQTFEEPPPADEPPPDDEEDDDNNMYVIGGILAALAVGGIGYAVFKKKKKKKGRKK